MAAYLPIWSRPPNKLVRYEDRPFDDGHGHRGVKVVAVYLDKSGNECEELARVKWSEER